MSERDPDLEKLYRAHSHEEPPSALDAKILAAAHSAVKSGPRRVGAEATRPQRWWMPLAAAATIGAVAIGVVQQMPKDTAIDATSVSTAPPPASAPVPAPKQAPAPVTTPAAPPAASAESQPAPARDIEALAKKQKKEADAPALRPPPPPPPADANAPKPQSDKLSAMRENKVAAEPMPFPAAPPPQKTEVASNEAKRDAPMEQLATDARKDAAREERQSLGAAGAPPPPPANLQAPAFAPAPPAAAPVPAQSPAGAARMRAQGESSGSLAQSKNVQDEMRTLARDPDAWIVRIRKLRDEGNLAQAQRELKEFRALVPDAERKLPPDLRALQP